MAPSARTPHAKMSGYGPSFIINSGSMMTFKFRLKTYFFPLTFDWPHHITAGASEVTTLWWYINHFIIIIIIIIIITLPSHRTVIAHAPCYVTYHWGQKWSTFLKSLTPIYLFTLSLSWRYSEDKPCYMRKITFFPILNATKYPAYPVTCT